MILLRKPCVALWWVEVPEKIVRTKSDKLPSLCNASVDRNHHSEVSIESGLSMIALPTSNVIKVYRWYRWG